MNLHSKSFILLETFGTFQIKNGSNLSFSSNKDWRSVFGRKYFIGPGTSLIMFKK